MREMKWKKIEEEERTCTVHYQSEVSSVVQYVTVMYCTVLYCTVLYCTILYYTVTCYIAFQHSVPNVRERLQYVR